MIFIANIYILQVCRLAYEIMNSFYSDASTQYTSLDDTYYFGGQKPRINEIVLNHKATGPLEIDLKIGDKISVAGNLWNGYSDGIILRTRKSGLYPTFKVYFQTPIIFCISVKKVFF